MLSQWQVAVRYTPFLQTSVGDLELARWGRRLDRDPLEVLGRMAVDRVQVEGHRVAASSEAHQ
jgi:hypothetical protein